LTIENWQFEQKRRTQKKQIAIKDTHTQFLLGKRTLKREKYCQNRVENLYMLAPKIENKTQNARLCEIEPKKCEKRKHRNPCQKPSTQTHFQFSLEKKRFLVKKLTTRKTL
jgi:hypothetical protein